MRLVAFIVVHVQEGRLTIVKDVVNKKERLKIFLSARPMNVSQVKGINSAMSAEIFLARSYSQF
jgi:hypothetical protein